MEKADAIKTLIQMIEEIKTTKGELTAVHINMTNKGDQIMLYWDGEEFMEVKQ